MKQFVGKGYTIYKHTNKVNGKSYIGQTKCEDLTRRWTGGNGYNGCPYFYNAIKRYGWNGFTHEVIETGLTKKEADEKEIYYIKHFDTTNPEHGYNIQRGGHHDGTLSEESLAKFRIRYSGENSPVAKSVDIYDLNGEWVATFGTLTEATKFLHCTAGSLSSKCTRKKGTLRGYICHYHETTKGMLQLPKEMIFSVNEQRNHCKSVAQYSLDGKLIKVFDSIKDAAKETGSIRSEITACVIDENRRYANGFMWKSGEDAAEQIEPLPEREQQNIKNGKTPWAKPIIRTDVNTLERKEYASAREAAYDNKVTVGTMTRWLKEGVQRHGYTWKFKFF